MKSFVINRIERFLYIDSKNNCEVCKEQESYQDRARKSSEVYRKDAPPNTNSDKTSFSIGMRKVLFLLHLAGTKTALFTRRIVMINQSIVPLGSFKSTIDETDEMKTLRVQ